MTWVLMAFDKSTEAFDSEVPLPDSVDEAAVRSLVGDYPNLRGDSFPVEGRIFAGSGTSSVWRFVRASSTTSSSTGCNAL